MGRATRFLWAAAVVSGALIATSRVASACGGYGVSEVERLAWSAVSEDAEARAAAISRLRALGQPALDGLIALWEPHEDRAEATELRERLEVAIDQVAQQRFAAWSGLYWHTDLTAAREAAAASNKPILSLRLLGQLTDELSCANSRFFRTVLYPNREVAAALRERFVLHWSSERPAPKITIDFGDGRRIVRTITGNSVHYVLDPRGRAVDALPGLFGPKRFLKLLAVAGEMAGATAALEGPERAEALSRLHRERREALDRAFRREVLSVGLDPESAGRLGRSPRWRGAGAPPAREAMPLAVSKRAVELPPLEALLPGTPAEVESSDPVWARLAKRHGAGARLDARSRELVVVRLLGASLADCEGDTPMARKLRAFEQSIATDTVHNAYRLHRVVRGWFAAGEVTDDLAALNERVYGQLFLTPRSDPWLGLVAPEAFSGLEGEGIVDAR
jgi:hypothetical protein